MTPTAGVDEVQKDHPVPSSGLSAERVEEIERDVTNCRGSWVVYHAAAEALLAEVRRLQGELAAAREETAQARKDGERLDFLQRRPNAIWYDDEVWRDVATEADAFDDIRCALDAVGALAPARSRSLPGETADA